MSSVQRRVLILGGSPFQVPLIEYAKAQGDYVITADYLPANPGHQISDEYHNVSTTDVEAMLALAKQLDIDAVMTFASDPALPALAAIAEQLSLPGPSRRSVELLSDKGAFRALVRSAGLPVPVYLTADRNQLKSDDFLASLSVIPRPLIVKPIDSCGSKGISIVSDERQLSAAFRHALSQSRAGRVIVEEYLEGDQIHGDGFMCNGNLIHMYLGDHYFFTGTGNRIPQATIWPSSKSVSFVEDVRRQAETVANHAGYDNGPMNIEARALPDGHPFIIECAPRNGGNHVPLIQGRLSGFNFLRSYYQQACGDEIEAWNDKGPDAAGCTYQFHSDIAGLFRGVNLTDELKKHLIRFDYLKPIGAEVKPSRGSGNTLAVFLLAFDKESDRKEVPKWISENTSMHIEMTVGNESV